MENASLQSRRFTKKHEMGTLACPLPPRKGKKTSDPLARKMPGGDSHRERTGVPVGNFEKNPRSCFVGEA